ncbi:MAG: DEAD/DEAH box helicase family protein, partial [Hungatella sp.]|nr:DEAD/DEAH box helicase family protein [Hungatella sp.]
MGLEASLVSSYSYEGIYLGNVYRKVYPFGYVSDRLKDVFSDWTCHVPVGVFSGTGTGKNTFVEKVLIPDAKRKGKSVLLFSNRVALNRQTKKRLAKIFELEYLVDRYTDEGLDEFTDFGNLTVVSYQQLEAWINENSYKLGELKKKDFAYVVCDEAHYFTSDCSFNAFTDNSLEYIANHYLTSVRIYMTATQEEIFPILRQKEKQLGIVYESGWPLREFEWQIYEFERDFSYINAYAFDGIDDLVEVINHSDEKWAVFVDKIDIGKQLIDKIGKGTLITAESKKTENSSYSTFRKIIDEERFDEQVIVSTAVLENGINIKDRHVKKIAIFCNDKVRFLQMLGRIRRVENCVLDVYIANTIREEVLKSYNCLSRVTKAIRN